MSQAKVKPKSSGDGGGSIKKRLPSALQSSRTSVNPLKKRKRDLKRLLEHSEKLPADVRIGYERELASCDVELEGAQEHARRSQMIKKYHMVRFFERRKAERYLKKARQILITCEDPSQVDDLKHKVHLCDVDLTYTQYYPLNEAYSSLYKKEVKGESDEHHEVNRSAPMWKVVEQAMASGHLQSLREGKLRSRRSEGGTSGATSGKITKTDKVGSVTFKTTSKPEEARLSKENAKKSNSAQHEGAQGVDEEAEDDQTGAGFFE